MWSVPNNYMSNKINGSTKSEEKISSYLTNIF